MRENRIKKRLYAGEVVLGPFLKLTDPAVVEIAGQAGFDFVIIDAEHGPISIENAQHMIRAAEAQGITPVVRVARNEEATILRALDIGAQGIEVPQINTREQAERLRNAVRFTPKGERGVCCYVRSADYSRINQSSTLKREYFRSSNEEILIIAHIEGQEGLDNIDAILAEEELDVIFIGPYDLSQSLGIPGEVEDPRVEEEMKNIVHKAGECDKIVGTFVDNTTAALKWKNQGVQFISYAVDVGIFYSKCQEIVSEIG